MVKTKYSALILLSFLLVLQLFGLQSFLPLSHAQPPPGENPILKVDSDATLEVLNYSFAEEGLIINFMNDTHDVDTIGIMVYANISDFFNATKFTISVDNNARIATLKMDFCDENFAVLSNCGTYSINGENGTIPIDSEDLRSKAGGAYCLKITGRINDWTSGVLYTIVSNLETQNEETAPPPPEENPQPPEMNPNANPRLVYWPPTQIMSMSPNHIEVWRPSMDVRSISWSPSGDFILIYGSADFGFGYGYGYGSGFYLINASGQVVHNVTIPDSLNGNGYLNEQEFLRPAMSPDEQKIFFVGQNSTSYECGIFSINVNSSELTPVVQNLSSYGSMPKIAISKDGAYLVYTESEEVFSNVTYTYSTVTYLWRMNLSSGEKSLLASFNETEITSVSISPSNDKIAFTTTNKVLIINPNGTGLTEVTSVSTDNTIVGWVDWSPNETMLTFAEVNASTDAMGNLFPTDFCGNISVVNLDGSNKHVIYSGGYSPAWSPTNSSLIAFVKFAKTDFGIFSIPYVLNLNAPIESDPDSDGDGLSDLTELSSYGFNPFDPTDTLKDYDNDGLMNIEEFNMNTRIDVADTDGDGLSDGVEVKVFKTDPLKADTDGDGVSDGLEAAATGLSAFVSVLPEGWIRIQLEWKNNTMFISTNSSVLGVVFNSTSMALSVSVGGPDGTVGIANLTIPVSLISSLSAVRVTLDNQPIDFTINQVGNTAQITVQYHHSFHQLTAELAGGGGIGPLNIGQQWLIWIVVGVAAIAVVIVFLLKKRTL